MMPITSADKRATFRKLHDAGCFVLPNPWDVGSAKALQQLGFKALASTSAGFAWSIGKADNRVTLEDALTHLTALCGAVDLPVNADFEGGFAHKAEKVSANVARAVKTGVAGLSIPPAMPQSRSTSGRLRSNASRRRARPSMPTTAVYC
jgi:2-methylisocitrate lyase-like PEP mutase family enzyme